MKYSVLWVLNNEGELAATVKMNTSSGQVIIVFSNEEKLDAFVEATARPAAEWGGRIGAMEFEASSMSEAISRLKKNTPEDMLGQSSFLPDTDPLCNQILMGLIEDESG